MPPSVDFLAIGDILIDMVVDEASGLDQVSGFKKCFGGAPGNFAVGVQRLGCKAGVIAKVGADPFGQFLTHPLEGEGVDVSQVTMCKERTSLAFVTAEPDYLFYRGADVELNEKDLSEPYIANARFLHFSGFTLSAKKPMRAVYRAVRIAKKHGLTVSFAVNYRPDAWTKPEALKVFEKFLPHVDILLASDEEAQMLSGQDDPAMAARLITRRGPKKAVVTLGSKGALLCEDQRTTFVPAFEVEPKDATGAGDGFAAGLMSSLAHGSSLEEAGRFACAVGALVTTRRGAITAFPTQDGVKTFLLHARQKEPAEVGFDQA